MALQAPTMDAVIALSERVQHLEIKPDGRVFTFLRSIDQTLKIGYTDSIHAITTTLESRNFKLIESRRGTRREERLLLLTLKELGFNSTYNPSFFHADSSLIRHLCHLGWPVGDLRPSRFGRPNQRTLN